MRLRFVVARTMVGTLVLVFSGNFFAQDRAGADATRTHFKTLRNVIMRQAI
jgi:hypothetical protein